MNTLNKQTQYAFGKDVYLLGEDEWGVKYWLESPSWDCGWYWGFGYVETYTSNDNPSRSRDINSHEHASDFMGWVIEWNGIKPKLNKTTFSDTEAWQLVELFKRFYMFKDLASYYHSGGTGVTSLPNDIKNQAECDNINQNIIKPIMDDIISILKPSK